ncbi:MAG: hypothetical protein ABIN94_05600 [Ferruginibacter sp.]
MKIIFLLSILGVVCSCNYPSNPPADATHTVVAEKLDEVHCYRYIKNKDTVSLTTIFINDSITGTLAYNLYEKDKNSGTIQGQMKGDLLIADYNFNSEGSLSTRQVAFKKSGNNLIEGYGEAVEDKGKSRFKNLDSLNFEHAVMLTEVACEK